MRGFVLDMPNGWIKLYRKTLDNGILRDRTAWAIFSWLLLKVNEKGQKAIGRYWAAKELDMNPNTFYKALHRLQNKYQMVTLVTDKVTIKYTMVTVCKWHFYQHGNRLSNNSVTIGQQSGNTLKEYRIENKEEPLNVKRIGELRKKAYSLIGKKI